MTRHVFTLVVTVAATDGLTTVDSVLDDARAYLEGTLEVGDGDGRIQVIEIHDDRMLS